MVAFFSSASAGSGSTIVVLERILNVLGVRLAYENLVVLHYLIRKSAHFVSYGILSALLFRAIRASYGFTRSWRTRWSFAALLVCLLVASTDELHQVFTPGRGGRWQDVVLDMTGAAFAQIVILEWMLRKSASSRRLRTGALRKD
jgi:VanZ family protein